MSGERRAGVQACGKRLRDPWLVTGKVVEGVPCIRVIFGPAGTEYLVTPRVKRVGEELNPEQKEGEEKGRKGEESYCI